MISLKKIKLFLFVVLISSASLNYSMSTGPDGGSSGGGNGGGGGGGRVRQ